MTEAPFVLETLYLLASAHGNVIVNLRSGGFFLVYVIVAWPVTMFYKYGRAR